MRQEINLYGPEFRQNEQKLSSKQIVRASLAFFALLMLVQLLVGWQWYSNTQQRETLQARHAAVSERLTRLKQSQPLSQRPRLEAQVVELGQQLKRLEELRNIISGQNLGNSTGFAHYLQAMARQTLPEVALSEIRLLQGGAYLELDGRTLKADAVPLYLQRLRHEASFNDVRFGVLQIRSDAEGGAGLEFRLAKAQEEKQ